MCRGQFKRNAVLCKVACGYAFHKRVFARFQIAEFGTAVIIYTKGFLAVLRCNAIALIGQFCLYNVAIAVLQGE